MSAHDEPHDKPADAQHDIDEREQHQIPPADYYEDDCDVYDDDDDDDWEEDDDYYYENDTDYDDGFNAGVNAVLESASLRAMTGFWFYALKRALQLFLYRAGRWLKHWPKRPKSFDDESDIPF